MILLVVIYHTNLTLADYNLSLPIFTLFDKFFRPFVNQYFSLSQVTCSKYY